MSLYKDASIVFIPSGYDTGKLFCPRPKDGGADLDFARTGSAWRIKDDGYMEVVSGSNIPRLDYTKSSCPALLQEPESTNLFNWSENYGYQWQKNGVTATQTTDVEDLFGNNKAIKLQVENTGGAGYASLYKPFTPSLNSRYTFSKFVRKGSTNWIKLQMTAPNGVFYAFFDLENGVVGNKNVANNGVFIEQYPNGWYRCAIASYYNSNTSGTYNCVVRLAEDNGDDYIPRDGQTYIYAYGGQVEKITSAHTDFSPTSYIPTLGSIVTRNAETTKKLNVSNYINSKKGVLYGEYAMGTENLNGVLNRINIYGNGTADRISIGYYAGYGNQIRAKYVKNSYEIYDTIGKFEGNETEFIKVAFRWQEGLHTLYVNGQKIAETTPPSSAVFADDTLESLNFGRPEEDYWFNGHIKEFMVFDELLSDNQMNELTRV
jgi:hypothetical protein